MLDEVKVRVREKERGRGTSQGISWPRGTKWTRRPAVVALVALLLCAALLAAHSALLAATSARETAASHHAPARTSTKITAPGVTSYASSSRLTRPSLPAPAADQQPAVAPAFADYYNSHGGQALLGAPITTAYPAQIGQVQFFADGALVLPSSGQETAAGQQSSAPTIHWLDVVPELLTAGSLVPVGGDGGTLTYADLRAATSPDRMVAPPAATAGNAGAGDTFIAEGQRGKATVGHVIPAAIWAYINQPSVSPDGWAADTGMPLTEALATVVTRGGATHHLRVQAFANTVLALDQDAAGQDGQPVVAPVTVGVDYLRTLPPPPVAVGTGTPAWAAADTTLLDNPGGAETVHVGANFPLKVAAATWADGALWYHVRWDAPKRSGDGWLPATSVAFQAPTDATVTTSFDVLSPDLAKYLAAQGDNTAAVVYDETRGRYYTYNATGAFTMASSAKVPILVTFLNWTESQNRAPTGDESNLLTAMIEHSDNDAAQALYEEVGFDDPIAAYLGSIGVNDWTPNPNGWGWSTLSPLSMVKILTLLHDGKILNDQDRQFALNLMANVESDQQVGVGDTAPQGATVQMKDGWVTGPDGLWAVNSSGIVTVGGETYIIAVYSQHLNALDDGWAIVRQVGSGVAGAMA